MKNANNIFLEFSDYPNLDVSLLLKEISRCKMKFGEVDIKYSKQEKNGYRLVGKGFTESVIKNIKELAYLASDCVKESKKKTNSKQQKILQSYNLQPYDLKGEKTMVENIQNPPQQKNETKKNDFLGELQQATLGLGSVIQGAIASSLEEGKKLQKELADQNRKQQEEHAKALKKQQEDHKKLLDEQRKQTEDRFNEHLKNMQTIENNIRQALDNAIKPLIKRIEATETRTTSLEKSLQNLTDQFKNLEQNLRNFAQELIKGGK